MSLVLPQESVAVNVTVFVPSGNVDGALLVTVAVPPQLSVAVTPCRNAAIVALEAGTELVHRAKALTVIFVGQVMLGAVVSLTVIVCVQVALLPHGSTALYVRRTVYRFGQVLLVVTSPTQVTVGVPQVAEAVTDATLATRHVRRALHRHSSGAGDARCRRIHGVRINHVGALRYDRSRQAVTVNVRVMAQGLPLVAEVTLMVGVPQVAVAVTRALTLAHVGRVGLQPKLPPRRDRRGPVAWCPRCRCKRRIAGPKYCRSRRWPSP